MNSEPYVESYVTCPYNASHRILRHRFSVHLVRCRKNHAANNPNASLVVCPFNSCHLVPAPELKYHMDEACPDRHLVDEIVAQVDNSAKRIEINFENEDNWASEEAWGDTPAPSYNPTEYCEGKQILRRLDIGSKAQRRQWHNNERLRFQELDMAKQPVPFRAPKTTLVSKPPVKEAIPESLASRMKEMTLEARADAPPPLSEILGSARNETKRNDEWEQVPVRGRGRGTRKSKN